MHREGVRGIRLSLVLIKAPPILCRETAPEDRRHADEKQKRLEHADLRKSSQPSTLCVTSSRRSTCDRHRSFGEPQVADGVLSLDSQPFSIWLSQQGLREASNADYSQAARHVRHDAVCQGTDLSPTRSELSGDCMAASERRRGPGPEIH